MNDRKCLQCYEQLRGRADQKFCNDQCRSSYNNSQYVESNTVIKSINRILKKNYSILASLHASGKTTAKGATYRKKGIASIISHLQPPHEAVGSAIFVMTRVSGNKNQTN